MFKRVVIVLSLLLVLDILRYFIYPFVGDLEQVNPEKTAFMAYREAEYKDNDKPYKIKWQFVPLSLISPYVRQGAVLAEDSGFYKHEGFDIDGLKNAAQMNIEKLEFKYGGSTITQQLAKNLYLSPSKNPIRKLKEAILTYRIERNLSKRRILELYLNIAEWGDGIFGIEAAARHYYHKSARNLNLAQASRLIAVLPNPIVFKVKGNQRYVSKRARIIQSRIRRWGNTLG